jgi:hypothetical protein
MEGSLVPHIIVAFTFSLEIFIVVIIVVHRVVSSSLRLLGNFREIDVLATCTSAPLNDVGWRDRFQVILVFLLVIYISFENSNSSQQSVF